MAGLWPLASVFPFPALPDGCHGQRNVTADAPARTSRLRSRSQRASVSNRKLDRTPLPQSLRGMKHVEPPAGFVDRFPSRGPWISPETPPDPYLSAQLLFSDGSIGGGSWVPAEPPERPAPLWWGWSGKAQEELHPIGWRYVEPPHSC